MRERTVNIDINSKSFRMLKYKQYDHNNILNIVITKDRQQVDMTSYTARGFFELPNKTVIERNLNVNKDTITATLESVILEYAGKTTLEIVLSNGTEVVTTFSIYLDIEETIDRNSAIEGSPEWDIIKDGLSILDDKVSHNELDERIEDLKNNLIFPQSDWNETDTAANSYILNKPDMDVYATKSFVGESIANASTGGGTIDLSGYAKTEDVGIKDDLTTDEKSNLVRAINEVSDKAKNNKSAIENLDEKIETHYFDKEAIQSNYYTKTEIDNKINNNTDNNAGNVDLSNYYTKVEINERLENIDVDLSSYYTKIEIDERLKNIDFNGGILIVDNEEERNALTNIENGEICYVQSKDEYYKYKDGTWEVFSTGNNSGGLTEVTLNSYTSEVSYVTTTDSVNLNFKFDTTGNTKTGRMTVIVNGLTVKTEKVTAGDINTDVTKYLSRGENTVEVNVSDIYGSSNFIIYTINLIELTLSSTFDYTQIFNDAINITYVANGNISKTFHVLVDGKEIATDTINTSGISKNCSIPKQSHGEHIIKMYVDCTLNEETVTSNILEYHVICIDEENTTPIISSAFNIKNVEQYTVLSIPYMVYTPGSLTSDVELYINDTLYSSLNVNRKLQKWGLSDYNSGQLKLKIKTGDVYKEFILTVSEVVLKTTEKTEGLQLHLTSKNRINDTNKENWKYGDITTTFTDFTWVNDGWQLDEDGYNALVIENNARAVVNFQPFSTDFKGTGKALEFEFKVTDVIDYDAIVISCMSGNRGIEIGCKSAIFKSNESTVSTKFKEDERVRVSFSVENKNQNMLIYVYINGILSGLTQYVDTDIFSQTTPVSITLGSNHCKLYVYNIRIYDECLGLSEALNNYIYDMNNMSKKVELIAKNNIYDDYGEVSYSKLLNQIPCMIITGELPPVKGDKKVVNVQYTNKQDETKNFNVKDITIDIQGTSSQYYPKKNYKIKLNDNYKLREGSVPGKVFCLKADYMESSHCHNTGMAKIVHGMYNEYVPTQTETNGVRTTIDGFPIALFYRESDTAPLQYFGIYNFNDDKDNTDTFGYTTGTECWEVCNNTSQRTLFRLSDYEIIGKDGNPEWYADFEARYPDKNRDYTNLKRLTDWIVSTDGDLDKFKNEFEQYFNLHYTLVYCVLTEMFAMIDSRAKNMFLASWDKTIWYPVFYDMDSCFGLNNEGELTFEYNVETNDTIGTQNVYNGKDSLLWQNFESCFADEIKETYNALRDSDKLTYESVLGILEGEQIAILSEAQYNEDAKYKYLDPLLNENISTYLYIAQGSRINHLKYWLFNRFNYMDSKYIASDYKDNYATMRLYTPENWNGVAPNSNFTITPFANQYSTVKFGSYVVSERGQADTPVEIVAPSIKFNDTETIIYGADRISSLGNLAGKYAGTVDMSKATQLTELIIGSNATGYSNTNLKSVSVGNNKLLRKIDVRNCPNLTTALDLSQCDNIQEVYATGTSITSVKLSDGTELTTLTLPSSITNLTLINKTKLNSVTFEGYNNLNTLRVENSAINPFTIINNCSALESVRLIDIDCQTNVISLQYLMTLNGMDENGVGIPLSQAVSGKISITECSQELLNEFKSAFPNVTFKALSTTTSWNVTFVDGDGNVIYTTKVLNNGEAVYLGDTPTKTSTAQYDYTWKGWDRQLKPIMSNCTITATFNNIVRYYTIRFINSDTLEVINSQYLAYGSTPVQPTKPDGFNAWKPIIVETVSKDMDYYTQYIPYPDDLSIFKFEIVYVNGVQGYNCTLLNLSSVLEMLYIIIPFEYDGLPVLRYSQENLGSFIYLKVEEFYIPDSIISLGDYAFARTSSLKTDLILPNVIEITSIGVPGAFHAFDYCSAEKICLPKLQTFDVDDYDSGRPFYQITSKLVTFGSTEYPFMQWHDGSSNKSFTNAPSDLTINLVTKNGLESDVAFNYTLSDAIKSKIIYSKEPVEMGTTDDGFEYIIINNEVKITRYTGTATEINLSTINGKNVTSLADKCFQSRSILTSVTLPNVTSLGNYCFNNCTNLNSIEIPNATSLGFSCFYGCKALTSIELPNVTSLGDYCFFGCSNLTSVTLPLVTSLGEECFDSCTALTSISLPLVTSLGNYCFNSCSNLTSIELPNVTSLDFSCFYGCKALTSIELPNVTSLGNTSFQNCSALTSVEIPNATSLGNSCFNNCTALTSIELPNVTSLGNSCFYGCSKLTSISLPLATSLGDYCFNSCSKLASVSLPLATSLGNSCFDSCSNLTSIEIPNVASLGDYCFFGCKALPSIELPNVTSIGVQCFDSCSALTSIELPNVTSLYSYCFEDCSKLTSVTLGGLNKPIINTANFNSASLNSYIRTLNIYVEDASNPPTLTGSPWGATNATIAYKQA